MKKLILILLTILTLNSCTEDKSKTYTLKYVVFYPNYNDTVEVKSTYRFRFNSVHGSNYIDTGDTIYDQVYNNSAPYKILNYTVKENKWIQY